MTSLALTVRFVCTLFLIVSCLVLVFVSLVSLSFCVVFCWMKDKSRARLHLPPFFISFMFYMCVLVCVRALQEKTNGVLGDLSVLGRPIIQRRREEEVVTLRAF